MKRILLITHHDLGDPGVITNILQKDHLLSTINYKNLQKLRLSEIKRFSLFIFIGGNMSANSKSKHILHEYRFLSSLIDLNMNILGICLGAQMIAKIYGSKISYSKNKIIEVGYRKIQSNNHKYFKSDMNFLQFHNEGIAYNSSMNILARGRLFEIDAFKINNKNIFGFQFHPEVTNSMIKSWYKDLDMKKRGIDKLDIILKDHKKFNKSSLNWIKGILNKILND
jgi:GMP synthase-like glutamine amidotransferase